MTIQYGIQRVLEPQHVLPTSAWKLDNSRNIYPDELKVSIKRIHLEGTGFKQICTESNDDEKKIKQIEKCIDDIETKLNENRDFPDPVYAREEITNISIVSPDLNCIVLGTVPLSEDSNIYLRNNLYIENYSNTERPSKQGLSHWH